MSDIVKLERAVIDAALARLANWERENKDGLLPLEHKAAMKNLPGRKLVEATIALRDALKAGP